MKHYLPLLMLILTGTLYAQPKTTGGGPDKDPSDQTPILVIDSETTTEDKFKILHLALIKIETNCTKTLSFPKPSLTFMDSYYRLTFQNIPGTSPKVLSAEECEQDNLVNSCLSNAELRNMMTVIQKDPNTYKYLESKFKLNKQEAKTVLDFFTRK